MTAWLMIFWLCVAAIVWSYAGFPLIVALRALLWKRPFRRGEQTPSVSMIIACFNEAAGIGMKLKNCLELDYPTDRLQIVVASDGSDDATESIVREFTDPRIQLLCLARQGKAGAMNAAVAAATGEVLVFSDANSEYRADAIRRLVSPFADPGVGGVAGNQVYRRSAGSGLTASGESRYWNFDRLMKKWQSISGNVTSATGAIYAIRRTLFQTVPAGVTDDFVTSTAVIAQGRRLVFEDEAVCYEPVAGAAKSEFSRKTRVITRGLRAVWLRKSLLNPFRYGFYALQMFSHKVARRLVAIPLVLLLVVSAVLWSEGVVFRAAFVAQVVCYALAACGLAVSAVGIRPPKLLSIPFYFVMVNAAVLVAVWNFVRGHRIDRWTTDRPAGDDENASAVRAALTAGSSTSLREASP